MKEIYSKTDITSDFVPKVNLCRFFPKQEYLDDFLCNKYRFGNLQSYRQMEGDPREDPTELEFNNLLNDGSTIFSFSKGGNYFAMCFTEKDDKTDLEYLREKFGGSKVLAYCHDVEDNISLTTKIQLAWNKSNLANKIAYLKWYQVIYDKSDVVESIKKHHDRHIYQKPRKHIVYSFKRIAQSPCSEGVIDCGGKIGAIQKLSNLKDIDKLLYNDLSQDSDWKLCYQEVNNFEIEREWRLVIYSGDRYSFETGGLLARRHIGSDIWLPG